MITLNAPQIVHQTALRWKSEGRTSLVTTMGCLHEGHLRLVRKAKQMSERCVVSIFVNPLQFGPNEDFAKYPRTLENDLELLEKEGVDCVFVPRVEDLY